VFWKPLCDLPCGLWSAFFSSTLLLVRTGTEIAQRRLMALKLRERVVVNAGSGSYSVYVLSCLRGFDWLAGAFGGWHVAALRAKCGA